MTFMQSCLFGPDCTIEIIFLKREKNKENEKRREIQWDCQDGEAKEWKTKERVRNKKGEIVEDLNKDEQ